MEYTAAVLAVTGTGAADTRASAGRDTVCELLAHAGFDIAFTEFIPPVQANISEELIRCADDRNYSLIITTGGTGFAQTEVTPEATRAVLERETPYIPQAMVWAGMQHSPRACLYRGVAGIRGNSLILNLPGSARAAAEDLTAVLGALVHAAGMLSK